MSLKFYGPHGVAKETLASGAPVPEGDFFQIDKSDLEEPHNIRLVKEGKILPSTKAAEKAAEDVVEREDELIDAAKLRAIPSEPMIAPVEDNVGETADENQEGGEA